MNESQIFLDALKHGDPAARSAFLDAACAGDAELRAGVEALLQAQGKNPDFLEQPAASLTRTLDSAPAVAEAQPTSDPSTPANIDDTGRTGAVLAGRYKLLELIGEGGMGTVWMAQQSEPIKRLVAVKLIKAGMDSKAVLARFEAERQALALMDHPNIAKVHDAGTQTSRPFFVMELVKGIPITKYCDEHHLTPRQRLELFIPVCQAVQHAHQKGIIHRDLKPSNVLVALYDGKPVPKVIDFGVAKAAGQSLTDKTLVTGFGNIVGTLEYMSPEQAEINQLDIDTRSDIYSLGVLLYELLAGSPPFTRKVLEKAGMLEMLRVIREQEPSKPSTKLSTAEGLPTLAANRGTEPAKLTKLVRGELDWIVMKALEKDRNRRYETANGFAMDVQRYLADEAVQACPPSVAYRLRKFVRRNKQAIVPLAAVVVALLFVIGAVGWAVRDGAARREEAAKEEATRQAKLAEEIGRALTDVEDSVQRDRMPDALAAIQRAEWLLVDGGGSDEQRRRVLQWRCDLDLVSQLEEIRLKQANAALERESVDPGFAAVFQHFGLEQGKLDAKGPAERIRGSAVRDRLVAGLHDWARWERLQGNDRAWKALLAVAGSADPDSWRDQLREAVKNQNAKSLVRLAADKDLLAQAPATSLLLAMCLSYPTDHMALAVEVLRKVQKQHPDNIWINTNLGHDLLVLRHTDEAVGFFRVAVALRPQSAGARVNLGSALSRQGKRFEAEAEYREALRLKPDYSAAREGLGTALRDQNKLAEAEAEYREALRIDPKNGPARRQLVNLLSKLGRVAELEAQYREATNLKPKDAQAQWWLGVVLYQQQKYAEAASAYREAVRLAPWMSDAHTGLGSALMAQRQFSEAEKEFREALRLNPRETQVHRNLARSLSSQRKYPEAEAEWREVLRLAGDNAADYLEYCRVLSWQRKFAEAEAACRQLVRLTPDQEYAHYELGSCLFQLKKWADAESAFREVIRLNPKNAEAHHVLGNLLSGKDRQESIAAYRAAIAADPKHGNAYLGLARVLRAKGEARESVAACEKAIQLLPKNPTAQLELGHTLKQTGDSAGAIAAYRKALELDPKDFNLWHHLSLAWELVTCPDPKLHEPIEALKLAQKAWERSPGRTDIPKVLGVAHYRNSDWKSAVIVLEKARHTNAQFYLAMAHWQLGDQEKARKCFNSAVTWLAAEEQKFGTQEESRRFRMEAAELLGIKVK